MNLNQYFVSKHLLKGNEPSRRDDIIQILYTLIFLLNRFKPLENLDQEAVIKFKTERDEEEFCAGQDSILLAPLLKEVDSYNFED